jgi:Bacterial pre-peptidase C-terminal domain
MTSRFILSATFLLFGAGFVWANPPVASYIFPAGGQRGKTVAFKVGGLFLHEKCGFEMLSPGVKAGAELKRTNTLWFEGPILPLPDSQRQEDYPKDMSGQVEIAKDAALGLRHWRLWTSQGATPSMKFMVGDLPEIVEDEIDGDPVPVRVTLPVTINGRIFPRANVDVWSFTAKKGETILAEVHAARLGSPLDARLEIVDNQGRRLAENGDGGPDPAVRFTAPAAGEYRVRIFDGRFQGGQAFVYRLTLTADPHVDFVYPLGGRRGDRIQAQARGQGLPESLTVELPNIKTAEFQHYFTVSGKKTNAFSLELDDLPEFLETEPNDEAAKGKTCTVPAIFNGRIDKPGDVDCWNFTARKGEAYEIDLRAGRLGSPLDGVIRVLDAAGKQLAQAEAAGPGTLDPTLTFSVPADGTYTVQVQDRFRSRGGRAFAYRLRVDKPPSPDFRLWLQTDAATVIRTTAPAEKGKPARGDASGKLKILVERLGGFKEAITLKVNGLPQGVTVANTTIAPGQNAVDLTFKADEGAAIKPAKIVIQGSATDIERTARLKAPVGGRTELIPFYVDTVLLAVALPTPFVIKGEYDMGFAPRGSVQQRKYKIIRNGFAGPLEVSLTDRQARHLQGVTGPTITVPAGAEEFTYPCTLPPWMETGRTCRVCVMAVGVIKDKDGSEHRVSFSSVNQNEQLVAVVGPGQLSLELERTSFTLQANKKLSIPVRIKRGNDVKGPVSLELIVPSHIRGLKAEAAVVAADQDRGEVVVQAAALKGPINMPLVVRATLTIDGQPVFAEGKIDVQPE